MCGIAGILHDDREALASAELVEAMCERIIHRGPDAYGQYVRGPVGLGHRRLSIIDVEGGDQPIFNEDQTISVVFNGEIYNHKQLQTWLERRGHQFRTRSDTEVLVHAYEEEGPDFVKRLRGMFAFALWDGRQQQLVLARDRLGKKPLYYYHGGGRLLFASELKAILADRTIDRRIDLEAICDYLSFLCIIAPKSPFLKVKKVPPAHYLVVREGHLRLTEYWTLDPSVRDARDRRSQQDALVAELDEAVACRLESEVPLGAFLSGGVDSSSIVALMSRHSREPVRTASIGFDDAAYDESDYAARVARRYRTRHHVQTVGVDAASEDELERLVWHLDEPFGDPSAIPTGRVSGIARKVVTVALSGDGGDEVFAGYRRHRVDLTAERIRRAMPAALRHTVLRGLGDRLPSAVDLPQTRRLKSALSELGREQADAHFQSLSYFREPEKFEFFTPSARDALGTYSSYGVLGDHWHRATTDDPLAGMLYVDLKTYLPDRMLMKVDKMSMMHSLEVRSPFLDHHLVEFGFRVPTKLKVRDGQGKWLLKKAMEPYLPNDVLYRPKQGFDVPLAEWLRGPLEEPLHAALESLGRRGYLAPAPMMRLFEAHRARRIDAADRLWMLYMLELWHRVFRVEV